MEIMEAIRSRHSVRQYRDIPLEKGAADAIRGEIEKCNRESGLHIQLVVNEPKAFDGFMAHYGKFEGVRNYIALIGPKGADLDEKCGYYGERLVLLAQRLGLNTCWVALTYSKIKTAFEIRRGEKLCVVIALGYGKTQGSVRKSKSRGDVVRTQCAVPEWFDRGVEAALLAPTAMNQQKFTLGWDGKYVTAEAGLGFYSKVDLGIVKYHFEKGAGEGVFAWKR